MYQHLGQSQYGTYLKWYNYIFLLFIFFYFYAILYKKKRR